MGRQVGKHQQQQWICANKTARSLQLFLSIAPGLTVTDRRPGDQEPTWRQG